MNRNFAVVAFDADGRIRRANNLFLRMFGYELDEIIGTDIATFARSESDPAVGAGQRVRPPTGRNAPATLRRLRKNGSEIWVEARYATIAGGEGREPETVAIVSDVTARKLQEWDERGQIEAINRSLAVVQFSANGIVLDANRIFLNIIGYELDEIVGRPYGLFVAPEEADGLAQAAFWEALAAGRHQAGEYRRIGKDGREVWLRSNCSPICDAAGQPIKIVEYAVDVTAERLRQAEYEWQVTAIQKSQAVISFDMHGSIVHANENFLRAMGYRLDEIVGRHHRLFVGPSHAHSVEYLRFWDDLKQGMHRSGQYKRIGKDGREVWLQATYNPVFDMGGRPTRVVEYATVITADKLQQAEYEGQIAAIHKSQCVVSFALDGTILDANDNFLQLTGYRYAEILGRHHRIFVEEAEANGESYRQFWRTLGEGQHRSGEFKRIGNDGREIWLQASYNPIFDPDGRPYKVVKFAADISAEKLRQAENAGQIEAINKAQGVLAMTLDGIILEANESLLATFGFAAADVIGRHHSMLVEPGHAATAEYREFWNRLRSGTFHKGMYKRIGRDGRELWLQASYNPILDLNGRPYKIVKYATDVTQNVEMAAAFENAKRQAQHDAATSLPNRSRLASFMSGALPHAAARLAVLYIDLDDFKPINDAFGHSVGDRVLGEVADRFRRILKDDQMIARVGGDEFVIAAPNLSEDEIDALCRRLLDACAAAVHHENGDLKVGASVGVAVAPQDGTTPDDLLRAADTALARSKQNGRGTYSFFGAAMNDRIAMHRALIHEMRHGITAGEFFLEYQPRFDTRAGTVRSVEALVRWSHPERGRIAPGDFIPLAERSGLIVPLGRWILETACRMAVLLPQIGISVNVSPVQFRDDMLVETVEAALRQTGLAPGRLELEITEGVLLEDAERARATLDRLKQLGVKLAIDDFGTGYSSMSYLCDYPFDVIKIDRKFISGIDGSENGKAVVQAILSLGKALGLSTTAEGVETDSQLAALAADHCHEVQGFLLSRPVPPERLPQILAKANGLPNRGGETLSPVRAA
ncbi:GGDEF and EAL domain-containing protein [Aureimonas leprariae]|uniref:PAS domain S-box protein n=1 Tax=Plantimonas leprariae TaxID=2615207 RepID=A0A7V7PPD4_9HYPH|nr:GGDEF and EAL domain-containing protein [Aureimonas leprariae]KAB0679820.1 PAS domain S-box protein [Aureimonas leprariae]